MTRLAKQIAICAIALLALQAAALTAPAAAAIEPPRSDHLATGWKSGPGGEVWIYIQRNGFGASAQFFVRDTDRDGDCVYVLATLKAQDAPGISIPDQPKVRPTDCGADQTWSEYRVDFQARYGKAINHLSFKVCRNRKGNDPCKEHHTATLPPVYVLESEYRRDRRMFAIRYVHRVGLAGFLVTQRRNKARQGGATEYNGFDWRDDGCSVPKKLEASVGGIYNDFFNGACRRHDFGYRNIGLSTGGTKTTGMGYLPSNSQRLAIDRQMHEDMRWICETNPRNSLPGYKRLGGKVALGACFGAAWGYYQGVANGGGPHFNGQNSAEKYKAGASVRTARGTRAAGESEEGGDPPAPGGAPPGEFVVAGPGAGGGAGGGTGGGSPGPDKSAPSLAKPSTQIAAAGSRTVQFALSAADNVGVTQMRVRVSGEGWRSWVPYASSGTVILPDSYGVFTVWFQVRDAAGNLSAERAGENVTRTAAVGLSLRQVDNNGNLRSCGSSEGTSCSDVVKKFRATISAPILPQVDLLLKAWRKVNGSWVESSSSPFRRYAIGSATIAMDPLASTTLLNGIWRFQVQVPAAADGKTAFAGSAYQYLTID